MGWDGMGGGEEIKESWSSSWSWRGFEEREGVNRFVGLGCVEGADGIWRMGIMLFVREVRKREDRCG